MRKFVLTSALLLALPSASFAAAIITDGNVKLGVNDFGHLNLGGGVPSVVTGGSGTSAVGVRWLAPSGGEYEATSHGCLCEGWGIAVDGVSGHAAEDVFNSGGIGGLSLVSFGSTASTATSVVELTGLAGLSVTHDFALSASADLYKVTVTIANNTGADVSSVVYRRAMDWDTSPTPFNEYVTIQGTATTTLLEDSSDDGFVSVNPLGTPDLSDIGPGAGCGVDVDFVACGPDDHGAAFDFALGAIDDGKSYTFEIYYGGAASKAAALAALGTVGAELYSMGWSYLDPDQDGVGTGGETTPTFIFAFKGVGGTVIVPPPSAVPLPAAGWLLLAGLGAIAGASRRRKAA